MATLRETCTSPDGISIPMPIKLRGYRWFNYNMNSPLGLGTARRIGDRGSSLPWSVTMQAQCFLDIRKAWSARTECNAPNPQCECGLYAWHTLDHISDVYGIDPRLASIGVVEAYGRSLTGSHGFRIESMKVLAVCYAPPGFDAQQYNRYGIRLFDDHLNMLEAFPPISVASIVRHYHEPTRDEREDNQDRLLMAQLAYRRRRRNQTGGLYIGAHRSS